MQKKLVISPQLVKAVLILQFIPILLFPPSVFNLQSQTWWLPAILVLLALIAIIQLFRKSASSWPLYLLAFAQGFNIISRLLMLMPQSTGAMETTGFDLPYFIISVIAMLLSTAILMFIERPDVKQMLGR